MAKPFVIVELDRPRRLRYGMNQLATLEDSLGVPVTELGSIKMGVKELRLFLWAGLSWEDPGLTLEKAGELADEADLTYLADKVGEALTLAFGQPKNQTGPVAEAQSGTGTKPSN